MGWARAGPHSIFGPIYAGVAGLDSVIGPKHFLMPVLTTDRARPAGPAMKCP